MKLQDRLNAKKAKSQANLPPEARSLMQNSTEELARSGILDKVLKAGEKAPEFSLPDHLNNMVSSTELINKGVLVIAFYRGVW